MRAVDRVLSGGIYFAANITPTAAPFPTTQPEASGPPLEVLDAEEREVARLATMGLASKEIGERLKMSPRTVERKRAQIMEKIGVRDLPNLVRWCIRHGLG